MLTDLEWELLRLLAIKAVWPSGTTRDEFPVELKLDRAIDEARQRCEMARAASTKESA